MELTRSGLDKVAKENYAVEAVTTALDLDLKPTGSKLKKGVTLMKKIIVAGLLAASMVFAGSGVASAGTIKDCVTAKAHTQLSAGQAALVDAYGDNKINVLSVIRGQDLGLSDIVRANFFVWSAGTACVLGE